MFAMPFTVTVTLLAVLLTLLFSFRVGGLRPKTGVQAPAVSGDPEFEKAYRVHYNTIEQLVLFLPMLWLAVQVIGDLYTGAIGALWLVGRLLYSRAYMNSPAGRGPGMLMTMGSTALLVLVVLWGLFRTFTA